MSEPLKLIADEKNSRISGIASAISGYGVAAIRGAFILNGSAAVAGLTKQSGITAEGAHVILFCSVGAGLAVLCAGASFVAQWYAMQVAFQSFNLSLFSYQHTGRSDSFNFPIKYIKHTHISFGIAAALYLASMVCYSLAAYKLIDLF